MRYFTPVLCVIIGLWASGMATAQNNQSDKIMTIMVTYNSYDYDKLKTMADAGDANAQYELSVRYYNGTGVAKDDVEAVRWAKMAAEQNHAASQNDLALAYKQGIGTSKNLDLAMKYYRMAANSGDYEGAYELGSYYRSLEAKPQNRILAYMWYDVGQTNGSQHAKYVLDNFFGDMPNADSAAAKNMAASCLESNYKQCGDQL